MGPGAFLRPELKVQPRPIARLSPASAAVPLENFFPFSLSVLSITVSLRNPGYFLSFLARREILQVSTFSGGFSGSAPTRATPPAISKVPNQRVGETVSPKKGPTRIALST